MEEMKELNAVSQKRGKNGMARMVLMGVRDAARELGVHENTLRRWEEKGFIRAIKLPTGVRRFRAEDVEELRREMYDDFADAALNESREADREMSRSHARG
jgi:excisionase family DNA binding protein